MEGTTRRDFVYSPDGTLLAIEEPISPSLLPDPVRRSLSINYPDYRIVAAERHRKGTAVEYRAVIRRGKKRLEVLFDKGGNILKSTRPQ